MLDRKQETKKKVLIEKDKRKSADARIHTYVHTLNTQDCNLLKHEVLFSFFFQGTVSQGGGFEVVEERLSHLHFI